MSDLCEKCGKHPIEYDSPGNWCRYCWTEWWVEGFDGQEKQDYFNETIAEIEKKYGPIENI